MAANKLQKQLIELENDLYAAIFPLLSSYETRGFNAHQRAQTIAHNARLEAEHWIGIQQKQYETETKDSEIE